MKKLVLAVAIAAALSSYTVARAATHIVDLGTLGGNYSGAAGLNDNGQVFGTSTLPGEASQHAFSWTQAGGMIDLGTLGGNWSTGNAMNSTGQIVGGSTTAGDASQHAFSWTQAGGMIDLGTLGGSYSYAYAVNDKGQVVGTSALWRVGQRRLRGERAGPGRRPEQHPWGHFARVLVDSSRWDDRSRRAWRKL